MSSATVSAAVPAPASTVARSDFPTWLPPMLVKELRQGLRTRGFVGGLVVFQLIMAIVMLTSAFPTGGRGGTFFDFNFTNTFFWSLLTIQLLVLTPSRALGGLQQEADSRTLDLLMLTRLDAWRVVLGKWTSLLAQALLLLIAMLPYGLVRYFTGSVDLLSDAKMCAVLLGGCAIMTAAGLWASGIAKALRAVMVIVAIISGQSGFIGIFLPALRGSSAAMSPLRGVHPLLGWFDGILLTAFLLFGAVSNIAPRAENYSLHLRLLGLFAVLPVPFAQALGATPFAQVQLVISGAFLTVVCAIEFGMMRPVLARHWRMWSRRDVLAQLVGRCGLPGWQSALCFATFATVIWIVCVASTVTASPTQRFSAPHLAWLGLLMLSGLAFPPVLLSFFPKLSRQGAPAYFATLAILGITGGLITAWVNYNPRVQVLKDLVELMPFVSFWFSIDLADASAATFLAQGLIALGVIGAGFWQARPYWRRIEEFGDRDRALARETGVVPR